MDIRSYVAALRGKTVAVLGIGVSNTPLIRLLCENGVRVVACDRKSREALGDAAESIEAMGAALRLGDDYYLRKARRLPKRAQLEAADLPFAVTDALWALLREPFARRAMAGLCAAGFGENEAYALLRRARFWPTRRAAANEAQLAACESVCLTQEETLAINDDVYTRFAERSVGVENAIHGFKSAFDRAAPLLALGVLALFAIALWITR